MTPTRAFELLMNKVGYLHAVEILCAMTTGEFIHYVSQNY